jgi:hypothetical protein
MSTKKTIWTWGLVSGGISSALMFLLLPFIDEVGFELGEVFGYTSLVLSALMVFFGIRSYREHVAGRRITFGRGFLVGLGIALVSSLLYVASWQVLYYGFMPDFLDKYATHQVEKAKAAGKGEAEIAKMAADMERFAKLYQNPLVNVAFTFLEPFPFGLVAAAISAGILRSKKETAPA